MSTVSDAQLLGRWRAGDSVAGNALIERHLARLVRFFRHKTHVGIEDLVQQTLLACVEGRDRLRDDASFRAYLFATARFVLYQHVQRRAGECRIDSRVDTADEFSSGIAAAFAQHHEQRRLAEALEGLPAEFQITLELYFWQGLSGREIAQTLAIPEATVRSRLRRGADKLRAGIQLHQQPESHPFGKNMQPSDRA